MMIIYTVLIFYWFNNLFQVFSCPGCSEFTVDFDSRCETERRFAYLFLY